MTIIRPGATIGVLGGGQLAQMLGFEALRMGYRLAVLDPDPRGPAGPLADHVEAAGFEDVEAARRIAERSDVVTVDTEHVPADLLEVLESICPVRPAARVLRTVQDRLVQREFLASIDAPQTRYLSISSTEEVRAAASSFTFPAVLKTRRSGYDGRGQVRVDASDQLAAAWLALGHAPAVLEAWVDFRVEISALLARGLEGEIRFHPVAENTHHRHVLHTSRAPARISASLATRATEIGARIANALEHVGMMAVELFVTEAGELLVNEIAPRTHNSGHYTSGACVTSQFEQHLRAICGLPLGDSALLRPAVMLNLLGEAGPRCAALAERVTAEPGVSLHLYGKEQVTPGRKMGHLLLRETAGVDLEDVLARLIAMLEIETPARG